jgi:IS30 family transposase
VCQTESSKGKTKPPLRVIAVDSVFERVQIDLIEMDKVGTDGSKYIISLVDGFSKYAWATPIPTKEAIYIHDFLKSIIYEFGPFQIIQSDNGTEFTDSRVVELLKTYNISKFIYLFIYFFLFLFFYFIFLFIYFFFF